MARTSVIEKIRIIDPTTGLGMTGKDYTDFTCSWWYPGGTQIALTTQNITTLGTYQAPSSAAHIRIKEISSSDPTKGEFEVHFHDDQMDDGVKGVLSYSVAGAICEPLELDLVDMKPVNLTQIGGSAQSATDAKDFFDTGYDPATNKVQGVVLVDTTTTNTDMRGTDSAATAASLATAQADLDILTGADGVTLATSQPNYAPATAAQATAIEADTQDLQTQIGAAGAGLTGIPKTGYKLASDGLDTVATTSPAGVASNFREMVVATWQRFFWKSTLTATQLKTYDSAGTGVLTTQTVSDDGTTQTQGKAS